MSNGYLLDTNAVLLGLTDPDQLSASVREAILRGPNFISAAVYWEVVLKTMKGKLVVNDLVEWWPQVLSDLSARPLPIYPAHIDFLPFLPDIHQDPFDRLMIAQAMYEGLCLVTRDSEIPKYVGQIPKLGIDRLTVIS